MNIPIKIMDLINIVDNDEDINMEYNNVNDLKVTIAKLKYMSDVSVDTFSKILKNLTNLLINITNDALLRSYENIINDILVNDPKVAIDTYIKTAYKIDPDNPDNSGLFRKKIISLDENFFLDESYDEYSTGQEDIISNIFHFKSFWKKLNEENKNTIKYFYLYHLCKNADTRYIAFEKYKVLRKRNKHFSNIFKEFDSTF